MALPFLGEKWQQQLLLARKSPARNQRPLVCKKSSQTPMAMQGCQLVVTRMNFQDMLRTEGFKHPTSCRAWMVGRKHGHGCDILVNPRRRCGLSRSCFATYLVELKPNVPWKKHKGLTVGSMGREQCFIIPSNSALIPGGRCVGFGRHEDKLVLT